MPQTADLNWWKPTSHTTGQMHSSQHLDLQQTTQGGLCVFSADINGDNVRVRVTNISDASTVFKLQRIAIDV